MAIMNLPTSNKPAAPSGLTGEPDVGPAPPNMAPTPTAPSNQPTGEPDQDPMPQNSGSNPQADQIIQGLTKHLDQLPDQDKSFLAAHMTPEFIRAIGLINGPEVAGYLNQFADQSKVLIPVPRDQATQFLQKMQSQQGQGGQAGQPAPQPQGQPQPAPQQPQGQPMMKPQPMPQQPQQPLPNGVTPAPMQHGIMAPRA